MNQNKEYEQWFKNAKEFVFEYCCLISSLKFADNKDELYYKIIENFTNYQALSNKLSCQIFVTPDEEMSSEALANYNRLTNKIEIRQSLFKYNNYDEDWGKETLKNIINLTQTFSLITHEMSHAIDLTLNTEKINDVDKFIGQRYRFINKLSEIYPEKKEKYKLFSENVYFTSPAEAFAYIFSHRTTIEFFRELTTYAETKYPYDKILDEMSLNDIPKEKAEELLNNGSWLNFTRCKNARQFLKEANYQYQRLEYLLNFHQINKIKLQQEVHDDFVAAAKQWLKNPYSIPLTGNDVYKLLNIKELYDEEFVDIWYQYSLSHDNLEQEDISTAELLLKLKEEQIQKTKSALQNANINVDEVPHEPNNIAAMREELSIKKEIYEKQFWASAPDLNVTVENGQVVKMRHSPSQQPLKESNQASPSALEDEIEK